MLLNLTAEKEDKLLYTYPVTPKLGEIIHALNISFSFKTSLLSLNIFALRDLKLCWKLDIKGYLNFA